MRCISVCRQSGDLLDLEQYLPWKAACMMSDVVVSGLAEAATGQWGPDHVYEDGSFMYTAETLSRHSSA